MNRYAPLFEPFELRGKRFANRVVMSPMTRGQSPGGVPGTDVARYYRRRAAHVGLVVTEGVGIDHPSALGSGSVDEGEIPEMHGEAALAGWRAVVNEVHAEGGLIMPQLWHMGPMSRPGTGRHPNARRMRPSGSWGPLDRSMMPPAFLAQVSEPCAPMSESDITDVIAAFGRSAAYARECGFDGIAIHGAHGYLIDSFLWDGTNHRTDAWGGDLAQRCAFAIEVVRAIRAAAGPDMIINFRFSQWKQQDFAARIAHTPHELAFVLGGLTDAGVDLFDASTRSFDAPAFEGSPLSLAGWAKKLTGKAVSAVGGVGMSRDLPSSFVEDTVSCDNLDKVVAALERGEFDLIGVGRGLLMDPAFITKIANGEAPPPFRRSAYATLD